MNDEQQRAVDIRLRSAVESSPSGLIMTDQAGRIVLVNREVERLFGYSREELLGKVVDVLVPERFRHNHAGFRGGFVADPRVRAMGAGRDLFGLRKDGTEVPVEIGLTPVVTEEGLFILSSIVDIGTRKRLEIERERLEDQLRQAQKMEALGTLAGGVAHDFNNILGTIVGYAELVRASVADRPGTTSDLDELLKATARGKQLIERILRFSRRQEPVRKPMDLAQTVSEATQLLRATLPAKIQIRLQLETESARAMADATSVHQVLMNLATNASQAMPDGGALDVWVQPIYVRDSMARLHSDLREGPYVVVSVRDTGQGIDPTILDRVFEPFFTTKAPGEGSGLGLSLVHGIMRDHEGAVVLESEPGTGTVVRCFFPALVTEGLETALAASPTPMGQGQRILYVDDEGALASLGERRLGSLGYRATAATDPVEALQLIKQQPAEFDLVVTDFSMPRLSGLSLAREITRIRPDLPVLMLTGFMDELPEQSLREAGIQAVIKKPVTIHELGAAVHQMLSSA